MDDQTNIDGHAGLILVLGLIYKDLKKQPAKDWKLIEAVAL